jgi:hypothetical protein
MDGLKVNAEEKLDGSPTTTLKNGTRACKQSCPSLLRVVLF